MPYVAHTILATIWSRGITVLERLAPMQVAVQLVEAVAWAARASDLQLNSRICTEDVADTKFLTLMPVPARRRNWL